MLAHAQARQNGALAGNHCSQYYHAVFAGKAEFLMWVVRIALQRPYTFIVLALLLVIIGPLTILRTPTDIFPNIDIPIVSVVWQYAGLPPEQIADRIISIFERTATTTVNDIEHIESQSLNGVGVVKFYFQPNVNLDVALSQITAISQTQLKQFPAGTTPPLVLSYNASSVPIIQLALSGKSETEQQLFDLGNNFIRTQLATVQGASLPFPYGGKQRQVQVDLDQHALQAFGLSAQDIANAIAAQNLILPSGTEKIGEFEYNIQLNGSPTAVAELNDLPVKAVNGTTIYVHDVAHVRDGNPPQTNIVRVDGGRAVLMTVQKSGSASTLDIINRVKDRLPIIRASSPPDLNIKAIGDQSIFVEAAVQGVIREGAIAAALTGLMILLFLGSWRSTLIITISIPLSILASLIALSALGETINIMTLGGLALAVGILVDDATVAIENINYHLEQGKEVEPAILDGAQQIAIPALVSTLCICIVFVPMFLLGGVARYLFVPLAEAVVFAMLASYVLSRTLVPTLAKYWLRKHQDGEHPPAKRPGLLARFQAGFERRFETMRDRYHALLELSLTHRTLFAVAFMALVIVSFALTPWIGNDFFPTVDAGQIKLHLRAHSGERVEETARLCDQVETYVRSVIPGGELDSIVDNIGLPISGINLSYSNSSPVGSSDADILITLKSSHHPVAGYQDALRRDLPLHFPAAMFSFLPADITSQILNFGLPAPIDVQITGRAQAGNRKYAEEILARMQHIAGIADLRIQQTFDAPEFDVDVDRTRAQEVGMLTRDVANSLLVSLSGTFQTAPTFWLDPANGVSYPLVTQTPQYQLESLDDLRNVPITGAVGRPSQILGGLSNIHRAVSPGVISHYNVQPLIDIYASVHARDLGGVGGDIDKILKDTRKDVPKGSEATARGQMQTMQSSFTSLYFGILFAILLVYLLIVVNFQSWLDPFIIVTALPAALAGIVWMLFITHTTLSVPALTGAIMSVGVATANSILMVSFARERMDAGDDPAMAAAAAGFTRLRPVMMTALAMIIGMIPMALGMGEGGEQNAPLGRAVIGGLLFATAATLFFVPVVFTLVHGRRAHSQAVS
jgi:CzcA family heavy metal efflux pump